MKELRIYLGRKKHILKVKTYKNMSYKQKFGVSPLNNMGPTDPPKKSKKEYTDISVQGSDDEMYSIKVTKDSPYSKMAKKMGSIPKSLRNVAFTSKTDPKTSGISKEESKRRENAYLKSQGR
jgi:hypothetical protein